MVKSSTRRKAIQKASEELPPKIVKISEELSCSLTEGEWRSRAQELAQANQEAVGQEERKKSVTKELNADVARAKSRAAKLTTIVASRHEQREVTVEVKYDYELGKVIKTRTDTGEVITDREMTDDERQLELELGVDANDFIEKERAKERALEEGENDGPIDE